MANEYLVRTPTSTGNRKIFTWAGWVKRATPGTRNWIFNSRNQTGGGDFFAFDFLSSSDNDVLRVNDSANSDDTNLKTTSPRRDPSSWMHLVLSIDTTKGIEQDRVNIYVNGVQISDFTLSNYPTRNALMLVNSRNGMNIGTAIDASGNPLYSFNGEMFDIFFIDGQALTPDVFGFNKDGDGYISVGSTQVTDFRAGQWSPHSPRKIKTEIERRGGFGVNGFYLPMNDSSNFGADFHITPNSIITLKGEDLPQPRNGAPTTSDAFVSQVRKEIGGLGFAGCVRFDGTGDSLQTTAASCWSASDNCTFECFIYPTTFSVQQGIFHTGANGDFCLLTNGKLRVHPVGSNYKDTKGTIPLNAWSHIALVQSSSNQRKVFINGEEQAFTSSGSPDSSSWHNPDGGVYIGDDGVYRNFFNGFMSNVRVIKGTALYTSNFTPPTKPLTNVTNTKLLCCNSSTSATASTVTPGTITANGDPFATTSEITGSITLGVAGISTATGANLVTNPSFDSNLSGWTVEQGTVTWSNGSAYQSGASGNSLIQDVTTVVGKRYTLSAEVTNTANVGNNIGIELGETGDLAYVASNTILTGTKVFNTSFTATSTSTEVRLWGGTGATGYWNNVTLKQEDAPRDYSADIKGSGTNRTPTASGTIGVGHDIPSHYGSAIDSSGTQTDALYYNVDASGSNGYGTGDFTFECWFYGTADPNSWGILMKHANNGSWANGITICSKHGNDRKFNIYTHDGSSNVQTVSPHVWPIGQWHHVVAERHNGQLTLYVNGVAEVTRADTRSYTVSGSPASSAQYQISIGAQSDANYQSHGYFQDVRVYKGVAKYKGDFDVNKPYTPVGIGTWRQVPDNCKNNFVTLNPLYNSASGEVALADGSLSYTGGTNAYALTQGTIGVSTSKWYWEFRIGDTLGPNLGIGVMREEGNTSAWPGLTPEESFVSGVDGGIGFYHGVANTIYYWDGSNQTSVSYTLPACTTGDIVSIALDLDNGRIYYAKNGTWGGTNGNPATGTSPVGLTLSGTYLPGISLGAGGSSNGQFNFGQNPTFSGSLTAGTYTDGNGKGLFKYEPPTGFLALCEDNLPAPAIADPGKHFKTVLYSGDGIAGNSITGVGFQPDLVWLKERTNGSSHQWHDSVRGAGNVLISNVTEAQSYSDTYLYSFASDGFTLGTSGGINASGDEYVAWCWKAGGPAVANNDGSITTQVSANRTAGFSIVTGTQTSGTTTFGHGLDEAPEFIITKQTNGTTGWYTWHKGIPITETLRLDLSNAASSFSHWVTLPTDSVFSMGSGFGSGESYVAYCWHGVEGYSKFGSYKGNGNADGPFVYCGFKPAWVMIKTETGTDQWVIFDSSRNSSNPAELILRPNLSNVENTESGAKVDLLSNGFKLRGSGGGQGQTNSANTFIFIAFAESPHQTANAK